MLSRTAAVRNADRVTPRRRAASSIAASNPSSIESGAAGQVWEGHAVGAVLSVDECNVSGYRGPLHSIHPAFAIEPATPGDRVRWRGAARQHRIEGADFLSDDGAVIVGCCDDEDRNSSLPVVWCGRGPPPTLLPPPDLESEFGQDHCRVLDLSGDGRIAVERCDRFAVRWVDSTPTVISVPDGDVPDSETVAHEGRSISADGSTILGGSFFVGGPPGGWIWTEPAGVRSVYEILEAEGIPVSGGRPFGQPLRSALTMSGSAQVLIGVGEYGTGASHYPSSFARPCRSRSTAPTAPSTGRRKRNRIRRSPPLRGFAGELGRARVLPMPSGAGSRLDRRAVRDRRGARYDVV
jgi:hypothetical protein